MYYYGVDPSTKKTGVAILDATKTIMHYEVITGEANSPTAYFELYSRLRELYAIFPPTAVWIEDQFFSANVDTLKKIVRVTSIVMLSVHGYDAACTLTVPASWRKVFVGSGKAVSKRDAFDHVNVVYEDLFDNFKEQNDLSDAIGIAWACVETLQLEAKKEEAHEKESEYAHD